MLPWPLHQLRGAGVLSRSHARWASGLRSPESLLHQHGRGARLLLTPTTAAAGVAVMRMGVDPIGTRGQTQSRARTTVHAASDPDDHDATSFGAVRSARLPGHDEARVTSGCIRLWL